MCVLCPGKDVGLVRFPPTPALNLSVETSCADNASPSSGPGLFVECFWNGSWSTDNAPVCACNDGYFISSEGICKGLSYANTESMV